MTILELFEQLDGYGIILVDSGLLKTGLLEIGINPEMEFIFDNNKLNEIKNIIIGGGSPIFKLTEIENILVTD